MKLQKPIDDKAVKGGMAKAHDNKGGRHSMERMNPQKPDSMKPKFKGITMKDDGEDTWGVGSVPKYEED